MEMVKEILQVVLQTVILTVIPLLVKGALDFFKSKREALAEASNNSFVNNIIERVGKLVNDVVTETTNTYVKNLKKEGKFDMEEQKVAFKMSFDKLNELINNDYKDVLGIIFGNVEAYLTSLIEAAVENGKKTPATVKIEK